MKYLNNSIDYLLLQFTGVAKKGYTFSLSKSRDSEKRKNQEILTCSHECSRSGFRQKSLTYSCDMFVTEILDNLGFLLLSFSTL